jgi:hypothetical protein
MLLTHEEVAILASLQEFVETPNNIGQFYTIVGVPSHIFKKLIIGLGLPMTKATVVNEGHKPSSIIRTRTEELVKEYMYSNPLPKSQRREHIIKLQAENTAIIEYLDTLHQRGKI